MEPPRPAPPDTEPPGNCVLPASGRIWAMQSHAQSTVTRAACTANGQTAQPLLVATRNRGKLRELASLLSDVPMRLVSLDDVGVDDEVEETGATFEENAVLKATAYARASGLTTLADDSGLEVDALGGEPGVRSARYAGPDADDGARVRLLLSKLSETPSGRRQARFRCAMAVASRTGARGPSRGSAKESSPTRPGAGTASATTRLSCSRRRAGPWRSCRPRRRMP